MITKQPQAFIPECQRKEVNGVFPGYEQIRIRMNVNADCPEEALDDLLAYTQEHSPVCNTVCRPVPVVIERVKT